jgi:hypothetical protein
VVRKKAEQFSVTVAANAVSLLVPSIARRQLSALHVAFLKICPGSPPGAASTEPAKREMATAGLAYIVRFESR